MHSHVPREHNMLPLSVPRLVVYIDKILTVIVITRILLSMYVFEAVSAHMNQLQYRTVQ